MFSVCLLFASFSWIAWGMETWMVSFSIKTFQYYVFCMTASKNLHNKMFEKLLKAQPRFFDINPSGRILNRFSKDMGSMDEMLPNTLLDVKWICCNLFCVFILVISIRPVIAIPTILAGILFYFFRRFYLSTSRHRVAPNLSISRLLDQS